MAVKKGRVYLLKEGDGGGPESFVTIAKLRNVSATVNGETVDISNKDSGGFRDLLDGGGDTSLSISADMVLDSGQATQENLLVRVLDKSLNNYQLDDGEFTITAAFQVTSYDQTGEHNNEQTGSIQMESSGTITKAAVV